MSTYYLDQNKNKPSRNFSRNEEKQTKIQENESVKILLKTEGRSRNFRINSNSESVSKTRKNSLEIAKETIQSTIRNKTLTSIFNKTSQISNLNAVSAERVLKKNDSQNKGNIYFWNNLLTSKELTYNSGTFNLPLVSVKMKTLNQAHM